MPFSIASVLPNCEASLQTIFRVLRSEIASWIARKYGVLLVRHCPGSALASRDRMRNLSAHSLTETEGGGVSTRRQSARSRKVLSNDRLTCQPPARRGSRDA